MGGKPQAVGTSGGQASSGGNGRGERAMTWPAASPVAHPRPGSAGGGLVKSARPGSIAAQLGLAPGDRVYDVGGSPLRDYIDYRYLTAEPLVALRVIRPSGTEVVFEVEKDPDEDLGLEFAEDIFGGPDAVRVCGNRCVFCFVDRLPDGLRPALYVKDDDYRLSFLHGNFITLTNLTQVDVDRIASLRLSPLYVSVHTTEPEVRAAMMGSPRAAGILGQVQDLIQRGITIHAQVVVCPGYNDGPGLERTLGDLAGLRPGVESVGVVPVGLTRFGPAGLPVRPASREERADILDTTLAWRRRLGGFAYPADELFLSLGREIPGARFYQDFPQLQNGIGLARVFLDDLRRLERRALKGRADPATGGPRPPRGGLAEPFLAVTGKLAGPLLELAVPVLARITGLEGEAVVAGSALFGPEVTVAGLLTGEDVAWAAKERGGGGPILAPGASLRAGSDEFLDGQTLAGLTRDVGRPFLDGGWLPSHMLAALTQGSTGLERE